MFIIIISDFSLLAEGLGLCWSLNDFSSCAVFLTFFSFTVYGKLQFVVNFECNFAHDYRKTQTCETRFEPTILCRPQVKPLGHHDVFIYFCLFYSIFILFGFNLRCKTLEYRQVHLARTLPVSTIYSLNEFYSHV